MSTVTQVNIDAIGAYFDAYIYPNAVSKIGMFSDIDNNGKVVIYISDIDTDTRGFFWPYDIIPLASISDSVVYTNQVDMIYINIDMVQLYDSNKVLTHHTIAHEVVHLLSQSIKLQKGSLNSFETWLEEGVAEGLVPVLLKEGDLTHYDHFERVVTQDKIKQGLGLFSWETLGGIHNYTLAYTGDFEVFIVNPVFIEKGYSYTVIP